VSDALRPSWKLTGSRTAPPRLACACSTGVADCAPKNGEASLTGEQVPNSPWVARPPLSPARPSLAEKVRQLSELVPSEGLTEAEEDTTIPVGGTGAHGRGPHLPRLQTEVPMAGAGQALSIWPADSTDSCTVFPSLILTWEAGHVLMAPTVRVQRPMGGRAGGRLPVALRLQDRRRPGAKYLPSNAWGNPGGSLHQDEHTRV
jgi:hypothetical protein